MIWFSNVTGAAIGHRFKHYSRNGNITYSIDNVGCNKNAWKFETKFYNIEKYEIIFFFFFFKQLNI